MGGNSKKIIQRLRKKTFSASIVRPVIVPSPRAYPGQIREAGNGVEDGTGTGGGAKAPDLRDGN